jgi:hypothetical protein
MTDICSDKVQYVFEVLFCNKSSIDTLKGIRTDAQKKFLEMKRSGNCI